MNDTKCVGEPEGWRKLVDQDGNVVNLDLIKALRQDLLQARLKIASYEEKLRKLRVKLKIQSTGGQATKTGGTTVERCDCDRCGPV